LLYDEHALDGAWDLVKHWTAEQREAMRRTAPTLGLRTPLPDGKGNLQSLAVEVMKISRYGLKARAMLSTSGDDETGFLSGLDQIVETGITPAERMLQRYHGPWNRDLTHAFKDYAF